MLPELLTEQQSHRQIGNQSICHNKFDEMSPELLTEQQSHSQMGNQSISN